MMMCTIVYYGTLLILHVVSEHGCSNLLFSMNDVFPNFMNLNFKIMNIEKKIISFEDKF